jgi:hypothetical protein
LVKKERNSLRDGHQTEYRTNKIDPRHQNEGTNRYDPNFSTRSNNESLKSEQRIENENSILGPSHLLEEGNPAGCNTNSREICALVKYIENLGTPLGYLYFKINMSKSLKGEIISNLSFQNQEERKGRIAVGRKAVFFLKNIEYGSSILHVDFQEHGSYYFYKEPGCDHFTYWSGDEYEDKGFPKVLKRVDDNTAYSHIYVTMYMAKRTSEEIANSLGTMIQERGNGPFVIGSGHTSGNMAGVSLPGRLFENNTSFEGIIRVDCLSAIFKLQIITFDSNNGPKKRLGISCVARNEG